MAVGAHVAIHVKVVEQDELARQRVLIGRDLLAEKHQVGRAIAFFHVPQHLVVGPVLLDDIDHVADRGARVAFGGKILDQLMRLRGR